MIANPLIRPANRNSMFIGALVTAELLLFLPYFIFPLWKLFAATFPPVWLLPLGLWNFLVSAFLLGHVAGYWLACGGALLLAVVAFFFQQPNRRQMFGLGLTLLIVFAFMVAPYQPAVEAAPGYTMLVPTTPTFFLRGLKNAQAMGEINVCQYQILGWQQQTLFYQSNCQSEGNQTWQFRPGQDAKPARYTGAIPGTLHVNQPTREATLNCVDAAGVYPPQEEYAVRRLYVPDRGYLSPDKGWLALITHYSYGAEDVILVRHE